MMQKNWFMGKCVVGIFLLYYSVSLQGAIGFHHLVHQFDFGVSAFFSSDAFYLGASSRSSTLGANSLVCAHVIKDDKGNPCFGSFISLACEKISDVNRDPCNEEHKRQRIFSNPVYNKSITDLTLLGSMPVVLLATDDVAPKLGNNQKIAVVFNSGKVKTNTEIINAADGLPGSGIAGIAAGSVARLNANKEKCKQNLIFAAVAPNNAEYGSQFGDFESGIAVLVCPETKSLQTIDAQRGYKFANRAVRLSLAAGELTAITQDSQILGIGKMYWDCKLERLYVPLTVKRSNDAAAGGVVALAVGRLTFSSYGPKLILESAVDLSSANFDLNSNQHIFGFFHNDATPVQSSLHHVRVLQTSTNKSYAILNGATGVGAIHNQVYAVPLVQSINGCSNIENLGRVAANNDLSMLASSAAVMPRDTDLAVQVGAGNLPSSVDQVVKEMFIVGDAVYVMLAGENSTGVRDATHETGIFASTALFDTNGEIMRWTPWRRVMGSLDRALGGGFDCNLGSFVYLTDGETSPYDGLPYVDTIKATLWGKSDKRGLLGDLVSVLAKSFSAGDGGVHQIFNFDQTTPTFSAPNMVDSLSLMVAVGYKRVALIQTGNHNGTIFNPNFGNFASFTQHGSGGTLPNPTADARVITVSGGALDTLGPVCCSDISRVPLADMTDNGWLFVGGHGGLAVLSQDDGNGWDTATAAGLKRNFVGLDSSFSFKRVGSFSQVRKVVSDDQFVYVLTRTKLFRIPLDAANFSTIGAPNPTIVELACAQSMTGSSCSSFRDMIISSKMALLATNVGLYRVGNGSDITLAASQAALNWTIVLAGGMTLAPVHSLSMVSATSNDNSLGGNVYVLTSHENNGMSLVHRFSLQDSSTSAIDSSSVQLIPMSMCQSFFLSFGRFWQQFQTDGAQAFLGLPPYFSCREELKSFCLESCLSGVVDRGCSICLDNDCNLAVFNLGQLRRNSASGAWVVPNHAGIRVHE